MKLRKLAIRCIVATSTITATVTLVLLGNSIGYINSLIAFATFSICGLAIIFVELVWMLGVSIYNTQRGAPVHIDRTSINEKIVGAHPKLNKNEKLQQNLDLFLLKSRLGNVYNSSAQQRARMRTRKVHVVQYADLMTDLFMFTIYLTILTLVVLSSRDRFAFYSMRSSVRQFMRQRYFNNETREPIDNGLFVDYLRNDFLPTIHTGKAHTITEKIFRKVECYWPLNPL